MSNSKNIADLEAASLRAEQAHDRALTRLDKIQACMNALVMLDDARTDETLSESDRAALSKVDGGAFSALYAAKYKLIFDIGRLEDDRSEAASALNSAEAA